MTQGHRKLSFELENWKKKRKKMWVAHTCDCVLKSSLTVI